MTAEPKPPPEDEPTAERLSDTDAARLLLRLSNLNAADEELADLASAFTVARAGARKLYAVDEARYEQPAHVFRALLQGDETTETQP